MHTSTTDTFILRFAFYGLPRLTLKLPKLYSKSQPSRDSANYPSRGFQRSMELLPSAQEDLN